MRKVVVFNQVSLDGYFVDAHGDMSWAHKSDPEWSSFTADNARNAGGALLFGRVTYEMMARFWPTPQARAMSPTVAAGMNAMPKVVFSRTLKSVTWENTKLIKRGLVPTVRRMKAEPGKAIAIMGSGTLVAQLAPEGLIDELLVVVNPIVLGGGRTMFEGIKRPLAFNLESTRAFRNGNVLLTYAPT